MTESEGLRWAVEWIARNTTATWSPEVKFKIKGDRWMVSACVLLVGVLTEVSASHEHLCDALMLLRAQLDPNFSLRPPPTKTNDA